MSAEDASDPCSVVRAYHERTKHRPGRFARSLGYMDWATQPDPFRRFVGAPQVELPLGNDEGGPSLDDLSAGRLPDAAPMDARSVGQLLYDSLALSAWKQHGDARWALRVNPSSGNLHPTEGYLITRALEGVADCGAVYHYCPREHLLERRVELGGAEQGLFRDLPKQSLLVGLSSIHWREAWKYGERAFRYCHHDVGHAIAAVVYAAAALGWHAQLLDALTHDELATLLGTHRQSGMEAERADALLLLSGTKPDGDAARFRPSQPTLSALEEAAWHGTPAPLSRDHHPWEIIDAVASATRREAMPLDGYFAGALPAPNFEQPTRPTAARRLIRQRRSAVDMDGKTGMTRGSFERALAATLPARGRLPFAALPWAARVHLLLFVHRVDDLTPGLYFFERAAGAAARTAPKLRGDLLWEPVEGSATPGLYLLVPTDVRQAAKLVSCHQDIAADGAFAVAMLAEVEPALTEQGAWIYERLHWETGVVGQTLYLEAEAAGLRSTGIGCFFDDAVHEVLGLKDASVQTLYHFTVGAPVEDTRLRTLDAYAHLAR